LFPIADEDVVLQIQESLEFRDFVQQQESRAALHDQQRRQSRARRNVECAGGSR
jgi:hypothetical protein